MLQLQFHSAHFAQWRSAPKGQTGVRNLPVGTRGLGTRLCGLYLIRVILGIHRILIQPQSG